MKIRRFWPIQWSPGKRKVVWPWKVVFNVPNIHLGVYKNYQNFHPLIFYGYTRLRGVKADLPPLGWIGLKLCYQSSQSVRMVGQWQRTSASGNTSLSIRSSISRIIRLRSNEIFAFNFQSRITQGLCIRMEFATVDYSTASDACTSLAENGM